MIPSIKERIKKESAKVNTVIALLVILLFMFLLVDIYFDIGRQGETIGKVTQQLNKTNRKYNARNVWNDLTLNSDVYNLDTIRTDDLSKMTIIFNDKTEVQIEENSMVFLDFSKNAMNINLINGSVHLNNLHSTRTMGEFKINSGESEINLKEGAVKLNKSYDSVLDIDVQEGKVEYKKGNTKQDLAKNEELKIRGEKIKKTQKKFRLLQPTNSKVFPTTQKQQNIYFEWEGEEPNYFIELYSLSGGIKKIFEQKISGYSFSKDLPYGKYSWKLYDEKRTDSLTEVFFVTDENSVKPLIPQEGANYYYLQYTPKILFSWSRNEFTPVYILEISKSRDFISTEIRFETVNESTVVESLGEGKYYYRILSKSDFKDSNFKVSRTQSFTIMHQKGPSKPELFSPDNYTQLTKDKVRFAWKPQEEFSHFRIQISKEKNFSSVYKAMELDTNSVVWQEPFSEGEYFWKIEGKVKGTQTWIDSETRKFSITDKPMTMPTIVLQTPDNHEEIAKDSVSFSWKSNSDKMSTFELTDNPDFANLVKSIPAAKTNLLLSSLKQGQYYWRIKVPLEGENFFYSNVNSFHFLNLPIPILEEPKPPAEFDVLKTKSASFKWKKMENISSYNVEVWREKEKIITENIAKTEWQIENLTTLKPGIYTFKVAANSAGKEGKTISSKTASIPFKVFLSKSIQKEEIKFKTPETIYIE